MDSPTSALLGVGGIGIGALIIFGAYKNVSVFGQDGLVQLTLKNGTFPNADELPRAFGEKGIGNLGQTTLGGAMDALSSIGSSDPTLAAQLTSELTGWSQTGNPKGGSARLKALVAEARSRGFSTQADSIQAYINNPVNPFATNTPGQSAPAPTSGGGVLV